MDDQRPVRVRRWALISAGAAPVLLIGGWSIAAALQPAPYNSATDTISALAGFGAEDRWLMTVALFGLGICHLVTASGIREAALPGRIILAVGGAATVGVALFPLPTTGESEAHALFASAAFACLSVWPIVAWRRSPVTSWALRPLPAVGAGSVLCVLLGLLAFSLSQAQLVGATERLVAGAQAIWPLVVVMCAAFADKRHR